MILSWEKKVFLCQYSTEFKYKLVATVSDCLHPNPTLSSSLLTLINRTGIGSSITNQAFEGPILIEKNRIISKNDD